MAGAVMAHQSPEGAFQAVVNIPEAFGGTGEDAWAWIACDVPSSLYGLLALGADDPRLQRAVEHLAGLVEEDGWHWEHQKRSAQARSVRNTLKMIPVMIMLTMPKNRDMLAAYPMRMSPWIKAIRYRYTPVVRADSAGPPVVP
jgi:hypothetical protein